MSARGLFFPYPTLGHNNDIEGTITGECSYEFDEGSGNIIISLNLVLKNQEIQALIDDGRAAFGVDLECTATYYRQMFQTTDPNAKISIPDNLVRGKVDVTVFIFTLEAINFYLNSFHEDYEDIHFNVPAGYYIGWWGSSSFIADKEFDPLQAPASSFIKVRRSSGLKGYLYADYGTEEIIIRLPDETWEKFNTIKPNKKLQPVIHSSLVLPILVEAITAINNDSKDIQKNDRLIIILKARNINTENPYVAAQKLLINPIDRSFESLNKLVELSKDSGGEE
jgi:hypothetical protein